MHFGRGATRPGTGERIGGPDSLVPLGEIFDDAERVPNDRRSVMQRRHGAVRREGTEPLEIIRGFETHLPLVERDRAFTHQHPGAQRPG